MKRRHKNKPDGLKKIARERISILFSEAAKAFKKNSEYSDRYVSIARKIALKFKIKLKSSTKRKFCKHCYKFLMPGFNCRVRLNSGKVVYYCFSCKKYTRIPYNIHKNNEKTGK